MNPRDPLSSRHYGPTSKETKGECHPRQGPAVIFQDHSSPYTDDTKAVNRGYLRFRFPLHAQISEKAFARTVAFVEHLVVL